MPLATHTASFLLSREESSSRLFATGFPSLDALLGGGAHSGDVLEVCGLADSNKSIVALSIAVSAVVDGGAALYIATTTEPFPVRAAHMIDTIIRARVEAAQGDGIRLCAALPRMAAASGGGATAEFVLRNDINGSIASEILLAGNDLRVARALDAAAVAAILTRLETILIKRTSTLEQQQQQQQQRGFIHRLDVVAIDGLAGIAYPILGASHAGHAMLSDIGVRLQRIARDGSIAVVISNGAVSSEDGSANTTTLRERSIPSLLRAALGGGWAHIPDTSLLLWRESEHDVLLLRGAILKNREPLTWIGEKVQESKDFIL